MGKLIGEPYVALPPAQDLGIDSRWLSLDYTKTEHGRMLELAALRGDHSVFELADHLADQMEDPHVWRPPGLCHIRITISCICATWQT